MLWYAKSHRYSLILFFRDAMPVERILFVGSLSYSLPSSIIVDMIILSEVEKNMIHDWNTKHTSNIPNTNWVAFSGDFS